MKIIVGGQRRILLYTVMFLATYTKSRPITSCWKILVEEALLNVLESSIKIVFNFSGGQSEWIESTFCKNPNKSFTITGEKERKVADDGRYFFLVWGGEYKTIFVS